MIAVIENPSAGKGKFEMNRGRFDQVVKRSTHDFEIFRTTSAEHVAELVSNLAAADQIWVAGGDGTVSEVIRAARSVATPIGILPCGTGNDLAAALGIPASVPDAAVALLGAHPTLIDIAIVQLWTARERLDRVMVNAFGVGVDAEAAFRAVRLKRWLGRSGYTVGVIAALIRWRGAQVTVGLDEDIPSAGDRLMVAVCNGPLAGGGFRIAPDAKLDDGLLDVCTISRASFGRCLLLLPSVRKGRHVFEPEVKMHSASRIELTTDRPLFAHLDGEVIEGVVSASIQIVTGGAVLLKPQEGS